CSRIAVRCRESCAPCAVIHVVTMSGALFQDAVMLQYLDPVPFTIDNEPHMGLSETQGLLPWAGGNLVVESRTVDRGLGVMKTASRQIRVPLSGIQSIRYEKRKFGFGGVVPLRVRSQHVLDDIPEAGMGMVRMSINRSDRRAAQEFCLALQEAVIHRR